MKVDDRLGGLEVAFFVNIVDRHPKASGHLVVGEFIENSITCDDYKVISLPIYPEVFNFGYSYHNMRIPT
jgi:hypothetical protein